MESSGFFLFRLNLVDRQDLFPKPISGDFDLVRVLEAAATQEFDVIRKGRRSDYRWALREVVFDSVVYEPAESASRPFVFVTFSREIMSRRGPIIGSEGITHGTSTFNPPPATLVRLLIDLRRHIVAIEDVSGVIAPNTGWKTTLHTILDSAAWSLGFTSMLQLNPVLPAETVAERVMAFDRLTRLRVTLRIPNPDLGPSFKSLYEQMERGGVRELTQDMRNERGLNLGSDSLPRAVLDMATRGYRKGTIRLYGYSSGRKEDLIMDEEIARIEIDDRSDSGDLIAFLEGYAAGQGSAPVKRFARAIIKRIDGDVDR